MDTEYRWCLTCGRAYHAAQVRVVAGRQRCGYAGCAGLYFAALTWSYLRSRFAHLPDVPQPGQVYAIPVCQGAWRRRRTRGLHPEKRPAA